MKKQVLFILTSLVSLSMLTGCFVNQTRDAAIQGLKEMQEEAKEEEAEKTQTENTETSNAEENKENSVSGSDASDKELGWDGEWVGDGVTVTITGSESGNPDVKFDDEEMHSSLDEAFISGNTLTGTYTITTEMYASEGADAENLPEQFWTLILVKSDGTIQYSRSAQLVWYNLNEDGTYGHEITKENSATLTKVYKTEN
ncbi:MAG: hypothetical protein K5776_07830 [Lachnospiraceae bacterium]|nr:hypothetical protein [Lachnospiraceae bacterium]